MASSTLIAPPERRAPTAKPDPRRQAGSETDL
jgi:hypothetical protein